MPYPLDPQARILVVDDAPVMLRILGMILARMGFDNVQTALSAEAALARLQREPCDLVISDYHMGGMSGYDLYRSMRSHQSLARIPFLLTTTRDVDSAACEEGRQLLRRCAVKPFTAAMLMDRIAEACRDVGVYA